MKAPQAKKQIARKWSVDELSAFYVKNRSSLVVRANRLLRDLHRSDEVVQEALLKLILAAPDLNSEEHALAYLYTTVDHLCVDIHRQEGRRPNLIALNSTLSESEYFLQDLRDHADVIAAADDAAIVRQALSFLSPAERAALVMWEVEGRSTSEIASELGVKESTVRHTVSRARASLRKILTEYVIDEDRGLTAIDLLSNSYRKVAKVAKDGSRVAFSIFLLGFAYLGFTNLVQISQNSKVQVNPSTTSYLDVPPLRSSFSGVTQVSQEKIQTNVTKKRQSSFEKNVNVKAAQLSFPGLDKNGSPTGFTITDSSGKLGLLYFNGKDATFGDEGVSLTSVAKTLSGAANVFLTQVISQDVTGTKYDASLSMGRQASWIPLNTTVISSEIERLASGNYLLTAVIQVESEVESTISIPAYSYGRDLEVAPSRVITRVLLNASKTQVVGQAVLVVERASK